MTRRNVLTAVTMSALPSGFGAAQRAESSVYLELKQYQLHTSPENQSKRVTEFLRSGYSPAVKRAGAQLIGAFANYIGLEGPFLVAVTQYDSLGAMQSVLDKLADDRGYQQALETLDSGNGYPFQREESSLLKTFNGMPRPLLSEASDQHPPRVFEMRRYESPTALTLARKVKMFNDGEIGIFERLGMRPVFFGATIAGERMPNLVYMLSFDNLAAREDLWKKFGSDPEWKKLSAPPELHDDRIVSNISNTILHPLDFSLMR
jgi:NIPSNAP